LYDNSLNPFTFLLAFPPPPKKEFLAPIQTEVHYQLRIIHSILAISSKNREATKLTGSDHPCISKEKPEARFNYTILNMETSRRPKKADKNSQKVNDDLEWFKQWLLINHFQNLD